MQMIIHQTVEIKPHRVPFNPPRQALDKPSPIRVIQKNILSSVPANGHMIQGSGELNSSLARHVGTLPKTSPGSKI
jgi:hypothetical protein